MIVQYYTKHCAVQFLSMHAEWLKRMNSFCAECVIFPLKTFLLLGYPRTHSAILLELTFKHQLALSQMDTAWTEDLRLK